MSCASGGRNGRLLIDLPPSHIGPDKQARVICVDIDVCAEAKAAIPTCRFVIAFGIGEGVMLPRQQRKPGANRI